MKMRATERLYELWNLPASAVERAQPLDPDGIPVAIPDGTSGWPGGTLHYKIDINQYPDTLHPNIGPPNTAGLQTAEYSWRGSVTKAPRRHHRGAEGDTDSDHCPEQPDWSTPDPSIVPEFFGDTTCSALYLEHPYQEK